MNNIESMVIGLTVGAGIGAGVSWYVTKKKYEKLNEENLQSLKDSYERNKEFVILKEPKKGEAPKSEPANDVREKAEMAKNKPDVSSFRKQIDEEKNATEPDRLETNGTDIQVITAAEYFDTDNEYSEFEKISLNYWTNGILTEVSTRKRIDNIDEIIGYDSLDQFDSEDIVYVRNHHLKTDYDIQKMDENYTE